MPHPVAQALPITTAATLLGLSLQGRRAPCFNAAAHQGGVDAHPSLTLYEDSNRYKCYACGIAGDLIDLVKAVRQISFSDAVRWIEAQTAGRHTDATSHAVYAPSAQTSDADAIEVYSTLYTNTYQINPTSPAGAYLHSRGLDLELVNQYGVSMITDPADLWRRLTMKFDLARLRTAGLVAGEDRFLFASHPLLFFYFDNDKPVYVQARDITGKASCKELSLAGRASSAPYNANLLSEPQEHVYVCEGCIDALSALQLGYPAVGVPGVTGFRPAWFHRFKQIGRVTVLFDDDEAGRRQAAELRAQFRMRGIRADAAHPNDVKDLNDLLQRSKGLS